MADLPQIRGDSAILPQLKSVSVLQYWRKPSYYIFLFRVSTMDQATVCFVYIRYLDLMVKQMENLGTEKLLLMITRSVEELQEAALC